MTTVAGSLRRLGERVARPVYRALVRLLPGRAQQQVRSTVARARLRLDKRRRPGPQVLALGGDGPVRIVSLTGLDAATQAAELDRLLVEPVDPRVVIVTDSPDLTELRASAVSFEYVPAYEPGSRWFGDRDDYDEFLARRLEVIRASYGGPGIEHPSSD